MKSKFISNTSNAVKEMEAWARTNCVTHEATRYLCDSITDREERVLRVKLRELSKERYKYLRKTAYEKNRFLDRLKRRFTSNVPYYKPRVSQSCSDIRSKSSTIDGKSASEPLLQHSNSRSIAGPSNRSSSRLALLNLIEPQIRLGRPKERATRSEERMIGRLQEQTRGSSLDRPRMRSVSFGPKQTRDLPPNDGRSFPQRSFPRVVGRNRSQTPSKSETTMKQMPPSEEPGSFSSATLRERSSEKIASWANKKKHTAVEYGDNAGSVINDPRYSLLEQSLCPYKETKNPVDVKTVVESLESLHLPAKTPTTSNQKRRLKVLSFMKERGIMFQ